MVTCSSPVPSFFRGNSIALTTKTGVNMFQIRQVGDSDAAKEFLLGLQNGDQLSRTLMVTSGKSSPTSPTGASWKPGTRL
jgi:lysozyme family protein